MTITSTKKPIIGEFIEGIDYNLRDLVIDYNLVLGEDEPDEEITDPNNIYFGISPAVLAAWDRANEYLFWYNSTN